MLLFGTLGGQDSWFRSGITTVVRINLALEALPESATFVRGGGSWQGAEQQHGKVSTKYVFFFIENYFGILRFPAGAHAKQFIDEFKDMAVLPKVVDAIVGT